MMEAVHTSQSVILPMKYPNVPYWSNRTDINITDTKISMYGATIDNIFVAKVELEVKSTNQWEGNPMGESIRILLVDDHDYVRMGLTVFIEVFDDMQLVGEASNGEEAVRLCGNLKPNIVLMDLMMPVMDGISAARIITSKYPQISVIGLTSSMEPEIVYEAKLAGITECLFKNVSIEELSETIRKVFRSQR
jgi:CheY-like chemotaxis protein